MPILGPYDISFKRIQRSIEGFVKSILVSDGSWRDFFESSTGKIIIRMMSGLGAFINFRLEFIRRETYLFTALLRSSIYLIADFMGFPVKRKTPPLVSVRVTNLSTVEQSFDLFRNMGRIGNFPLAVVSPFTVFPNESKVVSLVVGQWKRTGTVIVSDKNAKDWVSLPFEIGNYDISNLYDEFGNQLVYISGDPPDSIASSFPTVMNPNPSGIRLSEIPDDLFSEDGGNVILVETYYKGGIIARFGNGVLGFRITTGNMFFYYLQTQGPVNGLSGLQLAPPDDTLSYSELSVINPGSLEDALEKLRFTIPSYFQSLRRAVSPRDHEAIFLNFSGDIISAKVRKVPNDEIEGDLCCVIEMAYLFRDEHRANDSEKAAFLSYMDRFRMFGFKLEFVDPLPIGVDIRVTIVLSPDAISRLEVKSSLTDTLNTILLKLGQTFHAAEITSAIMRVPGVLRVYLNTPWADREAAFNEYYRINSLQCDFTSDVNTVSRFIDGGCATPLAGYVNYSPEQLDDIQGV